MLLARVSVVFTVVVSTAGDVETLNHPSSRRTENENRTFGFSSENNAANLGKHEPIIADVVPVVADPTRNSGNGLAKAPGKNDVHRAASSQDLQNVEYVFPGITDSLNGLDTEDNSTPQSASVPVQVLPGSTTADAETIFGSMPKKPIDLINTSNFTARSLPLAIRTIGQPHNVTNNSASGKFHQVPFQATRSVEGQVSDAAHVRDVIDELDDVTATDVTDDPNIIQIKGTNVAADGDPAADHTNTDPSHEPPPSKVPRSILESAMGFEASYAPLDDSFLLQRQGFDEEVWERECKSVDVHNLKQIVVLTRSGRRKPRPTFWQYHVLPLLEQLEKASADTIAGQEFLAWFRNAGELGFRKGIAPSQREAKEAFDELEAQGAGIFAELFLRRGLASFPPDKAIEALVPWQMEVAHAGEAGSRACASFERGFRSAVASNSLQVRLASLWRAEGRADDRKAAKLTQALWPSSSLSNASWLIRRPWCPRFALHRVEQEQRRDEEFAALAPRLSQAIRQQTGLAFEGNVSLGIAFVCQAVYAINPETAERALPCRILSPFLTDMPGNRKGDTWRATGKAGRWAAHKVIRQLIDVLHADNSKSAGMNPRILRTWCTDGVIVSAVMSSFGFLEVSADPRPSLRAPAASRLVITTTKYGAVCARYNSRPVGVATNVSEWINRLAAELDVFGSDADALCENSFSM